MPRARTRAPSLPPGSTAFRAAAPWTWPADWGATPSISPRTATRDAYDVIVVARFLDRRLIPRLVDALRPGGHVVYDHHYITPVAVDGPSSRRFRTRPNELLERFRTLRILSYEEGIVADPDGRHMALARLVACRGSPGY